MAKTINDNDNAISVTMEPMRTASNRDTMKVTIIYGANRMEMTMIQAITLARHILYITGSG